MDTRSFSFPVSLPSHSFAFFLPFLKAHKRTGVCIFVGTACGAQLNKRTKYDTVDVQEKKILASHFFFLRLDHRTKCLNSKKNFVFGYQLKMRRNKKEMRFTLVEFIISER